MRAARCKARRGVALLEALVALVVLMTAGASVTALVVEASHAVEHAHEGELQNRRATRFFETITLWPREDLDRHLGEHGQGAWRLEVERSSPTLYVIVLKDSLGARALLRTVLYRPGVPHDTI